MEKNNNNYIPTKKEKKLLEEKITDAKIEEKYSKLSTIPLRLLSELEDVDISSPANGEYLRYNATSGKWENST